MQRPVTQHTGDDGACAGADEQALGNAVFFFRDGRLVSELREAEFQSLLGGVASLNELAGGPRDGVFCEVGAGLVARALVFFRVTFDAAGRPSGEFSLPLNDLARRAGAGPDLGYGRVRLACRAQCPIPWLSNQLWQPRSLATDGECGLVQRALQKNRLGFRSGMGRPRREGAGGFDGRATLDGRAASDGRAGFDGRATLDGRGVHAQRRPVDTSATLDGRVAFDGRRTVDGLARPVLDAPLGATDARLVVPQLVRQYQARIDSLEAERVKAREQLLAARGEISRLSEELKQERERSLRLERKLRGSDFG